VGDWARLADVTGDSKADLVVHDPSKASNMVPSTTTMAASTVLEPS
jgi:hypothetical protein